VTTYDHVTTHGQFPALSLQPVSPRTMDIFGLSVASITVAAGVPQLNNAGHARRYLLHSEPKRTANYKIKKIRKETKT